MSDDYGIFQINLILIFDWRGRRAKYELAWSPKILEILRFY